MPTKAATKIQPLADRVVVKPLEEEEQMRGGLYIPDTAKEKPKEGKVISVGTGKRLSDGSHADFQVKKNDRIIFSSYAGTEIKVGEEEYLIMSEDDVLAVIEG